jgi:hypothetical protein
MQGLFCLEGQLIIIVITITFYSPWGATQAIRLCNLHPPPNSQFSTQGQEYCQYSD